LLEEPNKIKRICISELKSLLTVVDERKLIKDGLGGHDKGR